MDETPAGKETSGPDPVGFVSIAPAEALAEALGSGEIPLDLSLVRLVRDRSASFLLTDPSRSDAISSALLRALRQSPAGRDAQARAIAWRARAEANVFSGRLREARGPYDRATREAEAAGATRLLGEILVGRVHHLSLLGDSAEADRIARRAERLLRRSGDLVYLGKLLINRGNADYQKDRYAEAYSLYRKAARVLDRAGIRDATWAGLRMNQAIACTNLSRIREAREIFLEAEDACARAGFDSLRAHARYNRAFLEALSGDVRLALALLEESGGVFERQGQRDMLAASRLSRSEIYLDLGMAPEAGKLARAAADAFEAEGMGLDAALARLALARGLLDEGRPAEALPLLADAAALFRRRRLRPRIAWTLLQMARAERDLGKPARASALARRALGIFEILRGSHGDAASRRLLAEISLARGAGARAERILAPARLVLSKIPAAEAIEVLRTAGLSARATGRRAEALRRLARAERLVEAQRRLIPGAELRARAFWRQARVYHDRIALELESRSPRFATLFRLAETARARGFRDRRARTPPATWRRLAERRALLGSLTRRLEEADPGGPRPASARDAAELRGRIQALEREILSEIHRIEAAELSPPEWHGASDPDRTASLLAAGEAFLSTFVAGDRVLVLILRREGREAVVLPLPAAEIRARVDRVQFQLDASALAARRTDANLDFLRLSSVAALRDLHAAVLEPIEPHLPSEGRLLVSPHDFLHRVPFECLHDDLGPIDRRFRIARTPSADAVARRSAAAGGSAIAGTILVCGLVEGGPAFAAAEIESVASRFEGGRTRILRDPTSSELLGALAGCRVLHLATHGAFREDNPLFSRLTTSDGAIFLLDILATRIEADLVVLSACESGSTHAGGTDDISGVAHGFLAAGARRIVASRWRIHDEATAALMAAFYRRADGAGPDGDPAAALALAQQEVRERWSHPFFWAGFSLYEA